MIRLMENIPVDITSDMNAPCLYWDKCQDISTINESKQGSIHPSCRFLFLASIIHGMNKQYKQKILENRLWNEAQH